MKTKQLISGLLIAISLLGATPVFAIGLNINNQLVQVSQEPVIQNGTTLVPLRVISEKLGASVDWKSETQQVTVVKGEDKIELTINSKKAKVNGKLIDMPQAPQTINGTTMLPVRFVAENLKCEVKYDKASQAVYVTSDGIVAEIPDTTGWKTTTIKNPKIINGIPYLTEAQVTECFNAIFDKYSNVHNILKDDTQIKFYLQNDPQGPRVNRRYVPYDKPVVKIDGAYAFYYPLEFIVEHFNGSYSYDELTKSLTVIDKGPIEPVQLVDTQNNTIKGYIKWADGTPASNIEVTLFPYYATEDGQFASVMLRTPTEKFPEGDYPKVLNVTTDENGYYEFEPIDTNLVPYMAINIIFSKDGKSYTTSMGSVMGKSMNPIIGEEAHVSTKCSEYPVMYIHKNWSN